MSHNNMHNYHSRSVFTHQAFMNTGRCVSESARVSLHILKIQSVCVCVCARVDVRKASGVMCVWTWICVCIIPLNFHAQILSLMHTGNVMVITGTVLFRLSLIKGVCSTLFNDIQLFSPVQHFTCIALDNVYAKHFIVKASCKKVFKCRQDFSHDF